MRDGLLFLHIVGVAGWIGGGLYATYAYSTVARTGPPSAFGVLSVLDKRASVYFGVTSGLVLLSGVGLVITSDAFGWGDAFVLIGLGAFLFSGIVQSTVGRKANERLIEAAETGDNLPQAISSWRRLSYLDAAVLFVVVWAMISKLGT